MVDRGLPLSLTLTLERSIDGVGDIKRWHTTSAFLSHSMSFITQILTKKLDKKF